MNEHSLREDILNILGLLSSRDNLTQRSVSTHLHISLGKTNYLLKSLAKKGLLKMKSFSSNGKKARKIEYMLTSKGIREQLRLTYHFLKQKEAEYDSIKSDWERIKNRIH